MKLSIVGLHHGEFDRFPKGDVTHLISLTGNEIDIVDTRTFVNLKSMFRAVFDDVIDDGDAWVAQVQDAGWQYAKFEDIRRLVNFAKSLTDEEKKNGHLLVHCHAGISRSTAAAMIALLAMNDNMTVETAWETVLKVRPIAHPNIWMIKLADKILLAHGAMTKFCADKLGLTKLYGVSRIPTKLCI